VGARSFRPANSVDAGTEAAGSQNSGSAHSGTKAGRAGDIGQPSCSAARARASAYALLVGNFIVATTVLAPAGMLRELAQGMSVSLGMAGLLVTFGGIVLCFGSPLVAWATSGIDRRTLLVGTVAISGVGQAASAFAPDYGSLLVLRLVTLIFAAVFTPQAAGTIALIVPAKERSAAIGLVFLGWSLAVAGGLPLVTFLASHLGWREAYLSLAAMAALSAVLLAIGLPKGLKGAPMSFRSWGTVFRSRLIVLILLITILSATGQFVLFTYLGPLLTRLAGASPSGIAIFFSVFGVAGFLGNVAASAAVGRLGALATSAVCFALIFAGMVLWSAGAGSAAAMAAGIVLWGLGFASSNSMQQARLAGVAPHLAGATIALNTSSIYIGQTVGSALGGFLIERNWPVAMGYASAAFLAVAVLTIAATKPARPVVV
jgi:predicted MFS family arabinose efflux permease